MVEYLLNSNLQVINLIKLLLFLGFLASGGWLFFLSVRAFVKLEKSFTSFIKFFVLIFLGFSPCVSVLLLDNQVSEVVRYSQKELTDLSMEIDGGLYKVEPEIVKQLGDAQFKVGGSKKYLGKIDCQKLTFKQCVENIKKNKMEIVSNLESSGKFAVKE